MADDPVPSSEYKADSGISARPKRLSSLSQSNQSDVSASYSQFVRRMRLLLPLLALVIVAVVVTWVSFENKLPLTIEKEQSLTADSVSRNELVNPRFESMDEENQPYTVTAKRAVQDTVDENLVLLEQPLADMLLGSGRWIAISAEKGSLRRDTREIDLEGKVRLYHDEGYQLDMNRLHIDFQKSTASTQTPVVGQGPAGTLEAANMQADNAGGHLVFGGPARLVLNRRVSGR